MIPPAGEKVYRFGVLLSITLLALAGAAYARLGESSSECDTRYGKPDSIRIEEGFQVRRYHKRGVEVIITFWKCKSVEVAYRKLNRELLSDDEQSLFLDVNATTSTWAKVDQVAEWNARNPDAEGDANNHAELLEDIAAFYLWDREDGRAEASYDRRDGILMISDVAHLERLAARAEAEATEAPPAEETFGF